MKIKSTSNRGVTKQTVRTDNKEKVKETPQKEVSDVVSLSDDAIAALKANATEEVSDPSSDKEPLPDPRATAKAILEKELARVFREIYL